MTRTEIINLLIEIYGYKSYLEIGVHRPEFNFNQIKCLQKIGVDPDRHSRATHIMTSDRFFANNRKQFNLIFIDGLHHADQVERDIENALYALAPSGTIVCHDMNPTTKEMQEIPRAQGVWTGDAWRAWLKFRRDPELSMHVLDTDYGVGIIQRGSQTPLPEIENPTYEQFAIHKKEWLNLIDFKPDPVSICVPVYEMGGHGSKMLVELLNSIHSQQDAKFEVIVSDNSQDDILKKVCKVFESSLDLKYFKNPTRGVSANTNFSISKASHDFIKPMYQDDKFIHPHALKQIAFALKFSGWVTCAGRSMDEHGTLGKPRFPRWSDATETGKNTIGMPSVIAYRKNHLKFDTDLKTMLDSVFYRQLFDLYGEPGMIRNLLIGSRYWPGSTSIKQGNFTEKEMRLIQEKYNFNGVLR